MVLKLIIAPVRRSKSQVRRTKTWSRKILYLVNSYFDAPRPTMGHSRRSSSFHPMLISCTLSYLTRRSQAATWRVGAQSRSNTSVRFELGTHRSRGNALSYCLTIPKFIRKFGKYQKQLKTSPTNIFMISEYLLWVFCKIFCLQLFALSYDSKNLISPKFLLAIWEKILFDGGSKW